MSPNASKGLGHYCVDILDRLAVKGSLMIVETGTMFKTDLEPGETDLSARSTYAIAKWMHAGQRIHSAFYSIDADASHINVCQTKLDSEGLGDWVQHRQASGADGLCRMGDIDFLLLDSDSDAENTFKEYQIALPRMSHNSIIVIDDAFKHPSVNKFRAVRPYVGMYFPLGNQAAAIPFGTLASDICREVSKP